MVPHVLPTLLTFPEVAHFFQGFVFQSFLLHPPVWRKDVLRLQRLRRMLWPQLALFVHLPGSWDGSFPWLWIPVWRKKERPCWLHQRYVLFLKWTAAHNRKRSTKMVEELFFGKKRVTDLFSVKTVVGFDTFHTICSNLRNSIEINKIFSDKLTFLVERGEDFWSERDRESSSLIGFFVLDCIRPWRCSQRFWSLHPSLGLTDSQKCVVSMLVRKHHSALCFLSRCFLSNLRWCALGLLLLRVCRIGWAFQLSLEYNFRKNSRTSDSAAKPFRFG